MDDWADILTTYHMPTCDSVIMNLDGSRACSCRLDEVIEGVKRLQDLPQRVRAVAYGLRKENPGAAHKLMEALEG